MSSFQKGSIDDHVEVRRIPNYKAEPNAISRVSILGADNKVIVRTHWIPGLGYVYCWGGACCKKYGNPTIKYVYPIVKYPTNREGDVIGGDIELQRLTITEKKDKDIRLKNRLLKEQKKTLADVDLLLIGGDKQFIADTENNTSREWIDFSIERTDTAASWKGVKAWREILKAEWEFYKDNIQSIIAKKIENDVEYYRMIKNSEKQQYIGTPKQTQNVSKIEERKALPNPTLEIVGEDTDIDDFFSDTVTKDVKAVALAKPVVAPVAVVEKEVVEDIAMDDDYDMFS